MNEYPIKIVGRYLGEDEGISVCGVFFRKNVLTDANVNAASYNALVNGDREGWFELYINPSREEVRQMIFNAIATINIKDLDIEMPTKLSEFDNDLKFVTEDMISEIVSSGKGYYNQIKAEDLNSYEGLYKVSVNHNLDCYNKCLIEIYNSKGRVLFDCINQNANSLDIVVADKENLNILIRSFK